MSYTQEEGLLALQLLNEIIEDFTEDGCGFGIKTSHPHYQGLPEDLDMVKYSELLHKITKGETK